NTCHRYYVLIPRPPRSTPFPTRRSSDLISDIELKTQRKRGGLQSLELEGGVRLGNLGPNHTPALMPAELLHGVRRGNSDAVSRQDRKSTRLNSSHVKSSYAVFCLKKKKN